MHVNPVFCPVAIAALAIDRATAVCSEDAMRLMLEASEAD